MVGAKDFLLVTLLLDLLDASRERSAVQANVHFVTCSGHILVAHVRVQVLLGEISDGILRILAAVVIDVAVDQEVLVD